jgi:molybdopterin synthase sulfur carrier subunit
MATVYVPAPLRRLTDGQPRISVVASNIDELIQNLDQAFPGFRARLCDESGEIKRFINVFVNGEEIRGLQGRATPLSDRDEVSIIPAMAGGTWRGEHGRG